MAVLILVAAVVWFVPYATRSRGNVASVATPYPIGSITAYRLGPGSQACVNLVALDPNSRIAAFNAVAARTGSRRPLAVELTLDAPGYRARSRTPANYAGGMVLVHVASPRRADIGTACFRNVGRRTVVLQGTAEPATASRSHVVVDGTAQVGSPTLSFYQGTPRSLLANLGTLFAHASNLTDRLIPVALFWLAAVLTLLLIPTAAIAAFYRALEDDDSEPRG